MSMLMRAGSPPFFTGFEQKSSRRNNQQRKARQSKNMRGKRSKQYRKLMQQYALGFGFREPYQVIVTSDIIEDAARFQMDLTGGISRTLHGEVKPCMYDRFPL